MEGALELRRAIAGKLVRENGIEADVEKEIVVTCGATGAYTAAIHALLDPGDGILLFEPYYGYHLNCASVAGLEPQFLELRPPRFAWWLGGHGLCRIIPARHAPPDQHFRFGGGLAVRDRAALGAA